MSNVVTSDHVYIIYATRETSQFNQIKQVMRCKILEAHRNFIVVESLKRYNKKYFGAFKGRGKYIGMPVRRVNKNQALVIIDETSGKWITWETVRRREGTYRPGRARGGK